MKDRKKFKKSDIAFVGVTAALYVALCSLFSGISFGMIQVRLSDALYQLLPHSKKHAGALILGTLVANIFSPLGFIDMGFGTLATAVGVIPAMFINDKLQKMWQKRLSTAICACIGMFFVAWELNIVYQMPLMLSWLTTSGGMIISNLIGALIFTGASKIINIK